MLSHSFPTHHFSLYTAAIPFLPPTAIPISTRASKAALLHAWGPNMQAVSTITPPSLHQRRVCRRPGELHDLPCTRGVVILRALRTDNTFWKSPGRHHLHQPPRRQHLLDVARLPPPAPATRTPAPATMAAAPSERHQTAATAPLFPAPSLLLFSPRCHGSPLHRAAGGVFAGGEANGEEKGCFAHDGFGLGFELGAEAQAYEEKPKFMKALIALGLPIDILWTGLDKDGAY